MNGIRLVLDRGAILRLALGSVIAAQLIFIAGAVVGFALHGEGVPQLLPATLEMPAVAQAPAPEEERRSPAAGAAGSGEATRAEPPPPTGTTEVLAPTGTTDAPAPTETAGPPPPEEGVPTRFAVQLGAFRSDANARQLQAELGNRGYEAVIVRRQNGAGVWLHHVQLAEQVLTREEATVVAVGIQDRERIPATAVRIGDPVGS